MMRPSPRRVRSSQQKITEYIFDKDVFIADLRGRSSEAVKANQPPKVRRFTIPLPTWTDGPREMHPALVDLYEKYNSKNKKAPIEVRVAAFTAAGYPEHIISKMVTSHEKRSEEHEDLITFSMNIFGKSSTKKEAPAKRKTLHQLLNIKKPRKAKIEDDVEEEKE